MIDGCLRRDAAELLAAALARGERPARLQVRGRCMEPLVRDGDWIDVVPGTGGVTPGRLVLARDAGGDLVCHRVLGPSDGGLLLAGDRGSAVAAHRPETVLGWVRAVRRGGLELRFDGRGTGAALWRGLDALAAALHLGAWRRRRTTSARLLDAGRRRLLRLRGLAWKRLPQAKIPVRSAGTRARSLPASSR